MSKRPKSSLSAEETLLTKTVCKQDRKRMGADCPKFKGATRKRNTTDIKSIGGGGGRKGALQPSWRIGEYKCEKQNWEKGGCNEVE